MVVSNINIGVSILESPNALDDVDVLRGRILLGPFKHHVLQKVAHPINGPRFVPTPHPHHDCSCHATHAAHGDENQP